MNETHRVEPFSDDAELLAVARTLANMDLSDESQRLKGDIRQHLLHMAANRAPVSPRRVIVSKFSRPLRLMAAGAAALILMTVAVFTIPPLRALAQEILGQIGIFQFTDEQTYAQQIVEGTVTEEAYASVATNIPITRWDVEHASKLAGFPVYEPRYLPTDYEFSTRTIDNSAPDVYVHSDFSKRFYTYDVPTDQLDSISLTQVLYRDSQAARQWPIGDVQPIDVTVNGNMGLWIEAAPTGWTTDDDGIQRVIGVNYLIWEQDGYTFWMSTFHLGQAEMLRIAESLAPPDHEMLTATTTQTP